MVKGGSMASIVSVNISERKGVIKKPIEYGEFEVELGMKGDAHSGPWHRMVSLLAQESIDKMTNKGVTGLVPGKFAENLTTIGVDLHHLPIGTKFKVNEVLMEVTQIGKECHLGCEIRNQVGDCIMPREGIFARILVGGIIKPGDEIKFID
jgi:MOSC domain-containing protein YiiM